MASVLVVDDLVENCRPLVRLLQKLGADAAAVLSGAEALEHLSRTPPRLVILDVMMPGMDGFQVLSRVRSDRRFDTVNVVMYSADSDPRNVEKAKRLGAQDYLVKGNVGLDVLETVVEKYGRGQEFSTAETRRNQSGVPADPSGQLSQIDGLEE